GSAGGGRGGGENQEVGIGLGPLTVAAARAIAQEQAPMRGLSLLVASLFLAVLPASVLAAEPSVTGQTGLISMPDARFAPEGSWRTGMSFMRPYQALWTSVTLFPWMEGSFRYTRIYHVPGFPEDQAIGYGDYKDKSFDAKLQLVPERGAWPAIALGAQDAGGGTGIFRALYGAASKRVGDVDLTLGYGRQRIDGVFGGARWSPSSLPSWSLVAEYDAYNYQRDFSSDLSGAANYKKAPAVGIEYRWGWLGAKLFSSHEHLATNTFINVPLLQRYFNGLASRGQLAPYVAIEYAGPDALREEADRAETLITFQEPLPQSLVLQTNEADFFALRGENVAGGRVYVRPAFSSFFNDPSGAFRYDLSIVGNYSRALAEQTFLQAQAYLPLYENISDVTTPSNSELPHVRSDIAEYRRHNHLKLSQLLVNRFYHSSERVYA